MPERKKVILLFGALFLFRLFFGLCQSNWNDYDEKQSYLTGLKFYTTGAWPYFGPDAAGSENSHYSQIPGALEGLAIGLPFYVLPIPEAPFIFLDLLSTGALLFLAWYIHRRLPALPFAWLCLYISVLPWSLYYPTHISNMSYLFFSGILFFLGLLESLPLFEKKLISLSCANFLMGFSLFWIMQFHLSYLFLVPLAAFSVGSQLFRRGRWRETFYFILGALLPLAFVLPTYLRYGLGTANSHSAFFVLLNWDNAKAILTLLARALSLVCFEVPTFIGAHTADRTAFLNSHLGILLPGYFLWGAGILQALILFFAWFKKTHSAPGWAGVKGLTLVSFLVVYGSFWFTVKPPLSHIYLVLFPLLMIYSCYCWAFFARNARLSFWAKVFVLVGLWFQLGYALAVAPRDSMLAQRGTVQKALQEKNYHLFAERRPDSLY